MWLHKCGVINLCRSGEVGRKNMSGIKTNKTREEGNGGGVNLYVADNPTE